ncbi:hypothetical protein AAFN60_02695 [Roseibacillus persicicus]|uniref:hypothetical protein n=1 Tax=Roseibacillus persicicus TaxID=454148 RepID=UPI00398A7A4E
MDNPYESPQPELGGVSVIEPAPIKVFGILHLVFGGIGIFGVLMSGGQLLFREAMMKASSAGDPAMAEIQRRLYESTFMTTIIGLAITLVVTVMIMRAGLKLVKKKRDAVSASTLYSYVSIGAKILTIILTMTMTLPAMNAVLDELASKGPGSSQAATMLSTMKVTMALSGIGTPLLMSIYPVLCLVLLKKKPVQSYLEQYGK